MRQSESSGNRRLLSRAESVLVVIDVQERYISHLFEGARVVEGVRRLLQAAPQVGVPILLTEQYPKGLGPTAEAVMEVVPRDVQAIQKMTMSCMGEDRFVRALSGLGCRQVVVAGIEAHACVNQTVHELLEADYEVHLVVDACSSRFPMDYELAVGRLERAGAVLTTVESVLLEWVRTAEAPEFQGIRTLIRDPLPAE